MFSLLKPTVSLLLRPYVLAVVLHPTAERSPTTHISESTISAIHLVPDIFGAETLDQ